MGFVKQHEQEKNNNDLSLDRAREVKRRAKVLAESGTLPPAGPWLAGHYYNSALLRVDVCFEKAVRYYLTRYRAADINNSLSTAFRLGFPPDLIVPFWPRVRRQVNSLKHESIIKTEGPAMPPQELLIVIERLLATIEWLFTHGPAPKEPPTLKYSGNPSRKSALGKQRKWLGDFTIRWHVLGAVMYDAWPVGLWLLGLALAGLVGWSLSTCTSSAVRYAGTTLEIFGVLSVAHGLHRLRRKFEP